MLNLMLLALILAAAPAATAFENLKAMVGDWEAHVGKDDKILRVSYRLISNDTALAETWTTTSGATTMTLFHLDGKQLVATHYCAQGNQPRLRWARSANGAQVFDYWDATNLASPAQSHLVHLELGLTASGELLRKEVYREADKDDVTELRFSRRAATKSGTDRAP